MHFFACKNAPQLPITTDNLPRGLFANVLQLLDVRSIEPIRWAKGAIVFSRCQSQMVPAKRSHSGRNVLKILFFCVNPPGLTVAIFFQPKKTWLFAPGMFSLKKMMIIHKMIITTIIINNDKTEVLWKNWWDESLATKIGFFHGFCPHQLSWFDLKDCCGEFRLEWVWKL